LIEIEILQIEPVLSPETPPPSYNSIFNTDPCVTNGNSQLVTTVNNLNMGLAEATVSEYVTPPADAIITNETLQLVTTVNMETPEATVPEYVTPPPFFAVGETNSGKRCNSVLLKVVFWIIFLSEYVHLK
jgi:hypothetical protein